MKVRIVLLLLVLGLTSIIAGEEIDLEAIHRIRDEAFSRSQVMDHLFYLTDVNGPRLTGSPGYRAAAEWAADRLKSMGLSGPGLEPWGRVVRQWSHARVAVQMKEPAIVTIAAAPMAWSAGTEGAVEGEVILATLLEDADDSAQFDLEKLARRIDSYIERFQGQLKGRIVLLHHPREFELPTSPDGTRHDVGALKELFMAPEPHPAEALETPLMRVPADREAQWRFWDEIHPVVALDYWAREMKIYDRLNAFHSEQGVAAVLRVDGRGNGGIIFADAYASELPGRPVPPPTVVLAPESYNRIARLVKREISVVLSVDVEAELIDEPVEGVNVITEIRGGSKADEVVMLGGHLDSWHSGTGAADNAAGCVVAMEAVRILAALDLDLARTVRIALWDGEEQGFYGSMGYVQEHFADPVTMRLKPEHDTLSVYFNLDNGGGKIRGVYLQNNDMARPIFESWFAPFRDLGVDTVTIRNTSLTDHHVFDAIGLPGFQFIQDPLDYITRTHHSDVDVYDHIVPGDLMQAAAVMASVVYHAANREDLMPRKPLPPPPAMKSAR